MTSKEALLKIEAYLAYDDFQEELKAIAKDLEVLQVFKDILPSITILRVLKYEGAYMLYNSINGTSITKEEYELLEEWLHYETNKG